MIPEILTLLLPVGKFILASTLMVLFYLLFYRGKTSYDLSRKYLVSIAIVAILLSQFHIIVSTPPVKIVKVEAESNITSTVLTSNFPQEKAPVSQKTQDASSFKTRLLNILTVPNILFIIYGLVTFILILSFIFQYFKIISMKRKGVVREGDGFEIVESAYIPTPFSFCKTIFIGQNLTGNKRDVVIKHEQWHIRHHHYVDVMVMETLVRLCWFNPVLWWVRKELRNISEYQTDRSVLDEGHELYKYQTIILEEVMEQNPYLANGFNNSFTKKRFIRMKNTIQARFTIMRRISIVPFLVGVFCLLSFTEGKGETRFVTKVKENTTAISGSGMVDTTAISDIPDLTKKRPDYDWKVKDKNNLSEAEVNKGLIRASENLGLAIDELAITLKTKNPASRALSIQKVIQVLELNGNSSAIGSNQINEQFCATVTKEDLIQTKTDFTQIKKEIDALKLEQNLQVKTQKFNLLALRMLQVNLIKSVFEAQMGALTTLLEGMMTPMAKAMDDMTSKLNDGFSKNGKSNNNLAPKTKEELDSTLKTVYNKLNDASGSLGKMNLSVDSLTFFNEIDSLMNVYSKNLGVAIQKLNKCIKKEDPNSIKKGLDVLIQFIHMKINGKEVGVSALSVSFIHSVSQRDLIQTTDFFIASKEKLDRLRKEKSIQVKNQEYNKICLALCQENLISKAFVDAMSNDAKKNMRSVTNTVHK